MTSKKAKPPRKKKPVHANKMLEHPFKPYTKGELELITTLLNENKEIHVSEILEIVKKINPDTKLTNTQIKKIRLIHFKGDSLAKEQMWEFTENETSRWFISRVKIHMNNRKAENVNRQQNSQVTYRK